MVSSSDRSLRIALAVCVGLGWLTAGMGQFHLLDDTSSWPILVGGILWLIFAPLVADLLSAALEKLGPLRLIARPIVWLVQLLPLAFLPAGGALAIVFGLSIVVQSHLYLASRHDHAAVGCLALPPVLDIIALTAVPSVEALALLPCTVLAAVAALLLLHGRMALGDLRRDAPDPAPEARFARIAYMLPLGLLLATLSGGGYVIGERIARAFSPEEHQDDQARRNRARSPGSGDQGEQQESPRNGAPSQFGQDLSLSGGSFPFGEATVMEIEPLSELDPGRPLHMRSMVLDHFDENGASLANTTIPPRLRARGGWIRVGREPDPEHLVQLKVSLRALKLEGRAWTAAFAPHPLSAIQLPEVLYHPDQVLVVPEIINGLFEYEVEFERRPLEPRELAALVARHPEPRYLALPRESAALDQVRRTASDWTSGARSDLDKVLRIVRRLELDFTYERTDLGFEGTEAVAAFLSVKRGYCTHFATTAALMLRTQGVPARLATGFLAHEWSEERGVFVVRERNAHAWIEVHFDGLGWLTVDPTPGEVGGGSFTSEMAGELSEPETPWFEEFTATLAQWRASEASLGDVLTAATSGVALGLKRNPLVLLLLSGGLLALVSLLSGRNRSAPTETPRASLRPAPALFVRMWRALTRVGHTRRKGQTQREFGGSVRRFGGADFEPLPGLIALYYRTSYGDRALVDGEEREVETFIETLEARAADRE